MASLSTDKNGNRRIIFVVGTKRIPIYVGKLSLRQAQAIKIKVEDLVAAKLAGHVPSDETSRWLKELDDTLYAKLVRAELVADRESATLGEFTRSYIDGRADIKPLTRKNLECARKYMLEHFAESIPLRSISEADAENFRQCMIGSKRSDNTIRRATGYFRQFFKIAKRRGLVDHNPFEGLPASVKANRERFFYVDRKMIDRILEHCPDVEWRLIMVLTRYGGLRCPSELLSLRWSDINWEHNRIRVPSPKTAHHEGGESRTIPLFPELRNCWKALNSRQKAANTLLRGIVTAA